MVKNCVCYFLYIDYTSIWDPFGVESNNQVRTTVVLRRKIVFGLLVLSLMCLIAKEAISQQNNDFTKLYVDPEVEKELRITSEVQVEVILNDITLNENELKSLRK